MTDGAPEARGARRTEATTAGGLATGGVSVLRDGESQPPITSNPTPAIAAASAFCATWCCRIRITPSSSYAPAPAYRAFGTD